MLETSHGAPYLTVLPHFGEGLAYRQRVCSARELFCALASAPDDAAPYLEPAFRFATQALTRAQPYRVHAASAHGFVEELVDGAIGALPALPADRHAARWPAHVAESFAPTGLTDGAWLRGFASAELVRRELGRSLLPQLLQRVGAGQAAGDAFVQRYASLLHGLHAAADVTATPHSDEGPRFSDAAYEHALLGLCLGAFPHALSFEIVGFHLWMSAVGPCPLLDQLAQRGAAPRLVARDGRAALGALARQTARALLQSADAVSDGERARVRIGRGFAAAHESYLHWERGVMALRQDDSLELATRPGRLPASVLRGTYTAPAERDSLASFALGRYGTLSDAQLFACLLDADQHPGVRLFARAMAEAFCTWLADIVTVEQRRGLLTVPDYDAASVRDELTVRKSSLAARTHVGQPFWLQGFCDLDGLDNPECRSLFARYLEASCVEEEPGYTPRHNLVLLAMSLHTRHFMPELLGLSVALGAADSDVVESYLARVERATPDALAQQWRRLWTAWRFGVSCT